jgi:outer membrane protein assembly factor BamB/ankyrin repeat protein
MQRAVVALAAVLSLPILQVCGVEGPLGLWEAAKSGDLTQVKALLAQGVDVNAKTPHGTTALGLAADNGHLEVVQYLLQQKAEVNVTDLLGFSPFGQAVAKKHTAIVKLLLDAGAQTSRNLLWTAARTGDAELVEFILKRPVQPTQRMGSQQQIIGILQFLKPEHTAVQKVLIKTLLETGGQVETVLLAAAQAGNQANNIELLQLVLDDAKPTPDAIVKVLDTLAPQPLASQQLLLQKLLEAGGPALDAALVSATRRGYVEAVQAILEHAKPQPEVLNQALAATYEDQIALLKLLMDAGAQGMPKPIVRVDEKILQTYVGSYADEYSTEIAISFENGRLVQKSGDRVTVLLAIDQSTFFPIGNESTQYVFQTENSKVVALVLKSSRQRGFGPSGNTYHRMDVANKPEAGTVASTRAGVDEKPGRVASPQNWPSFRGLDASGIADGQLPPTEWDAGQGTNIRWKTSIPGLGHASPIVWNDRVLLATAIPSDPDVKVKTGFDDAGSLKDSATYSWRMYCLDKNTGKILWEQTAHEGVPQAKRHAKATFANSTPATDGQHVVACFGSEGLFCYDIDGKLVWKQSLGVLDLGWALDSNWKWDYGFASSPIIHAGLVIVQCDWGKSPFIAAYDIGTGKQVWRMARQELPTHAAPAIYQGQQRSMLIANSASHIRGYNPMTGEELWSLAYGESGDAIPTPIVGHDLIFVTHGWSYGGPIFAIRPEATGDISLTGNQTENQFIAWSSKREGPYLPTPIVYGDYLYSCSFRGILTCLDAKSGKQVFRQRLGGSSSYTASPVAADGKLYFAGEDGTVRVVKGGPKFETLAANHMGDACLATPAISDGMIFVRTLHDLFGIGHQPGVVSAAPK